MTTQKAVVVEVVAVTFEVGGRRTRKHLVTPVKGKLRMVSQKASLQAAGIVEVASAVDQSNAVDLEEV